MTYNMFGGTLNPTESINQLPLVSNKQGCCGYEISLPYPSICYRPSWMLLPDWLVDSADTTTSRQFCKTRSTGYRYGNASSSNCHFLLSTAFVVRARLTSEASALLLLKSVDGWGFVQHNGATYNVIRASHKDQIWYAQFPSCCTANMELSSGTSLFINHQLRSVPGWTQIPPVQVHLHMTLPPRTIEEWTN